ncbi:MAG: glucose-6-phosphate dehydrogenase assembly protein OpcA [Bryobacteraceae bacterium]
MTPAIQPDRILRELAELWVTLGKPANGDSAGVLRACAMTLVVIAEADEDPADVGETLAALMREHPSRAIVVRVRREGGALESRVFAQCWKPFGRGRQICCEQIEITTPEAALPEVPAVILPLAVADLPVIVWRRLARLTDVPLLRGFSALASKTIVDSATAADPKRMLRVLAEEVAAGQVLGDLVWTRITRWRALVAQIFENPVYAAQLPGVETVRVRHAGTSAPVSAYYLAAWLRAGLESVGARVRVSLEQAEPVGGNLVQVELAGPGFDLSIRRVDGSAAEVRVSSLVWRTVFERITDEGALRQELAITGPDAVFERSLALAEAM